MRKGQDSMTDGYPDTLSHTNYCASGGGSSPAARMTDISIPLSTDNNGDGKIFICTTDEHKHTLMTGKYPLDTKNSRKYL
jgi:hypothetical protein